MHKDGRELQQKRRHFDHFDLYSIEVKSVYSYDFVGLGLGLGLGLPFFSTCFFAIFVMVIFYHVFQEGVCSFSDLAKLNEETGLQCLFLSVHKVNWIRC